MYAYDTGPLELLFAADKPVNYSTTKPGLFNSLFNVTVN